MEAFDPALTSSTAATGQAGSSGPRPPEAPGRGTCFSWREYAVLANVGGITEATWLDAVVQPVLSDAVR